jgi:hypothetical protein
MVDLTRATTRKNFVLQIVVTVPAAMTRRDAMREVRSLITDQCNYAAEPGDVRVRGFRSRRPLLAMARLAP